MKTQAPWSDSILLVGAPNQPRETLNWQTAQRIEYRFDLGWYTAATEAEAARWE